MSWNITFDKVSRVVEATYSGTVTTPELQAGCAATLDVCREHHTSLVLSDCSRLESGFSMVDLYDLARSVATVPAFREAVLLPADSDALDAVRFWEVTATNRGVLVRLFKDRRQAIEWLKS